MTQTRTAMTRRGAATMDEGSGIGGRADDLAARYEAAAKPVLVLIFLITVMMPVFFFVGPVRLTFLRLFLMIMLIPLLLRMATGRHGGFLLPDFLVLFYPVWTLISILLLGQTGRVTLLLGEGIDIIGGYLLARVYIRSVQDFVYFVKCYLMMLLIIIPFAMYESLTRTMPISLFFDRIPGFGVHPNVNYEPRMGLFRAQVMFEHPILYGVFCSAGVSLAWMGLLAVGADKVKRAIWTGIAFMAGFFSLSTGALLAMSIQFMLWAWEAATWMVEKRWRLLILLTAVFYLIIDMLSNRTPVTIFISLATFNTGSSWNRVLIWEYGSASVWRNPIFGIGFSWWERPLWMKGSIDNFWLLISMRYGIPAFLILAGAFFINILRVGRMDFRTQPALHACQRAYLMAIIAVSVALCTVHIWGDLLSFMMFFLGAGVWMYTSDADQSGGAPAEGDDEDERRGRRGPSRISRSGKPPRGSGPTRKNDTRADREGRNLPTSRPPVKRKDLGTTPTRRHRS